MIHVNTEGLGAILDGSSDGASDFLQDTETLPQRMRERDYRVYGVDNDFDLAEAMYADLCENDPRAIHDRGFVEFRLDVATCPEFTERCLASSAFADIRDEIVGLVTDAR